MIHVNNSPNIVRDRWRPRKTIIQNIKKDLEINVTVYLRLNIIAFHDVN